MGVLRYKLLVAFLVLGILVLDCEARKKKRTGLSRAERKRLDRLQILQKRETDPVNFSRLVVMRVIYGVASWMGIQDRLSGVLNGAFVPPGAEDDDYAFGGFDDDDDGVGFDFFDGE